MRIVTTRVNLVQTNMFPKQSSDKFGSRRTGYLYDSRKLIIILTLEAKQAGNTMLVRHG